jgi:serine/threonine protein kinase
MKPRMLEIIFPDDEKFIEKNALDFIKKSLKYDKTKRLTCEDALNHPFLI